MAAGTLQGLENSRQRPYFKSNFLFEPLMKEPFEVGTLPHPRNGGTRFGLKDKVTDVRSSG